ncbi:MAG: hypothetical protein ACOCQ0_02825, partial [Desulfosalsimonas sp.]
MAFKNPDRPQLSDWLNISNSFLNVAQSQRQAKTQKDKQDYYQAQTQRQQKKQEIEQQEAIRERRQEEQEQAVEQQKAELENAYVDYLSRGGRPGELSQITPEDADPGAARKARIDAMSYMKDQAEYSQENAEAKVSLWEQDRQELAGLTQKAEMALESGDREQFNDIITTAYNNYIYDGARVKDFKTDKKGNQIIVTETVDGEERKFKDDLSDEQKLQFMTRVARSPEEYIKQRLAEDRGKREFNAKQWKEPEPVKGKDGKTYWRVKQVDPGTYRPSVLYFDEEPDVDSEPIAVDGSRRYLDRQALELEEQMAAADAEEEGGSAGPDLNPLTKNQALNKLEDYYYSAGPMGEMMSRMEGADEKYKVAEEKFNELVSQMEEEGQDEGKKSVNLHQAAIRA